MTVLLFCFIVLLALFSGSAIFAGFGSAICTFMYGTFGYGCFLVVALLAYLGVWLAFEKKIKVKARPAVMLSLTVYALFLLFHAVSTRNFVLDGSYISQCYLIAAEGFPSYTLGGVLSAILVYPVALVTTFVGAYIIFAILAVLGGYFTVQSFRKHYGKSVKGNAEAYAANEVAADRSDTGYGNENYAASPEAQQYQDTAYPSGQQYAARPVQPQYAPADGAYSNGYANNYADHSQGYVQPGQEQFPSRAESVPRPAQTYSDPFAQYYAQRNAAEEEEEDKFSPKKLGRKILFERDEFAAESYRRNGIFDENSYFNHPIRNDNDYLRGFSDGKSKPKGTTIEPTTYTSAYQQSVQQQTNSVPDVLYGAAPAQKLEDDSAQNAAQAPQTTSPYTAPETPSADSYPAADVSESGSYSSEEPDFGAPETEFDQRDELDYGEPSFGGTQPLGGTTESVQPSSDAPAEQFGRRDSRRLDDTLFPSSDRRSDSELSRRDSFLSDMSRGDSERARTDFSRLDFSRGNEENDARTDDSSVGDSSVDDDLRRGDTERRVVGFGEPSDDISRRSEEVSPPAESGAQPSSDLSRGRELSDFGRGRGESFSDNAAPSNDISSLFSSSNSRLGGDNRIEPDISRLSSRRSNANLFDDESSLGEPPIFGGRRGEEPPVQSTTPSEPVLREQIVREPAMRDSAAPVQPSVPRDIKPAEPAAAQPEEEKKPPHVWKKYVRPSLDLLDDYPEYNAADTAEIEESKRIIVETLEGFRIGCEISDVVVGPAITRFDVIILDRTNIKTSLRYRESIAMALKKENVNAYLNYSKGALSIEVPNAKRATVGLKTMMRSTAYSNAKTNSLTFALGKNVEGACICPDITKMPHLLVAGTTGSGKSICLSSLLISLLYKYGPEELRFILVDPKQVEFISYDKLPHLMINEIIYDVDKAIKALNWAIKEMERRYTLFKDMTETGANAKGHLKIATKDINEYNSHLEEGQEKLPKIVIVLDEFGDLMLQAKKDIESRIIKLVQKARAAGIHLILATQRPSVDCITGLIKSNLPTRIGFKVGSFDDSRTIFDVGGAEKLLGKGDMYFRSAERPELMRIQGCFVDTPEVQRVTDFIKQNNETYFDQSVSDFINKVEEPEQAAGISDSESTEETKIDDTFIRALKYCVMSNAASVSMIQRRFPIGYIKACKIIDWMENMNYITKSEGSKSRKVLLSQEEFFNTYGDVDD